MFDKLKKLLGGSGQGDGVADGALTQTGQSTLFRPLGSTAFGGLQEPSAMLASEGLEAAELQAWAKSVGASVSQRGNGLPNLGGTLLGKPWRMEIGRSSRDYIKGNEIRMRAELGVNEDAVALVMTRELKDKLEKAAYSLYTDPLQTTVDPNLPEEMRWLAMFQEFGWPEVGVEFFDEFAVLADARGRAMDFLSNALAQQFVQCNRRNEEGKQLPLVVMVMRGKAYLRTVHEPANLATVAAAHALFASACAAALDRFSTDLPL